MLGSGCCCCCCWSVAVPRKFNLIYLYGGNRTQRATQASQSASNIERENKSARDDRNLVQWEHYAVGEDFRLKIIRCSAFAGVFLFATLLMPFCFLGFASSKKFECNSQNLVYASHYFIHWTISSKIWLSITDTQMAFMGTSPIFLSFHQFA